MIRCDEVIEFQYLVHICVCTCINRIAGMFGGVNVWRITELKVIGEIKFGEWIDFGHKVLLLAKIWLVKSWTTRQTFPLYGMCLFAGSLTLLLTNPIWVVKTRLCLKDVDTLPQHMRYHSFRDGIYKLTRHEGLSGMYKVIRLMMMLCTQPLL